MIDFKLRTDENNKDMIYSPNGYEIEMIPYTNNELPLITESIPIIYNQTLAIYGTINQGQMIDNPNFGLNVVTKRKMQNSDITGNMYQMKLLEELSDMIMDMFLANKEILDYVSNINSMIEIDTEL